MAIDIKRVGSKYTAEVTPPHGGGLRWSSTEPMGINQLVAKLQELGCHQTDIGDALSEADPEWDTRALDEE